MFCVYSRYIKTGKEDFVGIFDNERDAVLKIANCYKVNAKTSQAGEYYYFVKRH